MTTFLTYVRTAWNDHFPATNPNNLNSQTYTSRQNPSDTSVYVSNCLFRSITGMSGHGGALYCTSAYFLIESTSFFSCKTSSGSGGAIYFYNTNSGQSVFYKVCGYDCCSTYTSSSEGQFSYVRVSNVASSKNYVNYSSIVRCVIDNSNSHYMVYLYYGKVLCPSINISLNKCYRRSGLSSWPTNDSNYAALSTTYSSFADNTAASCNCFWLNRVGAKYEIKSCNIIRNAQVTSTQGTIYVSGDMMIEDSCILENNATCIFFQASSYTITLSNCTVDSTSKTGSFVTQNTVTKGFILALNHMSTQNCNSEYDFAGTLTPIIQTPSSSKKQRLCYTYGKFLYQCQLFDFVSFISIFIFNLIHPYSSSYY
jgi:hypothetical protein